MMRVQKIVFGATTLTFSQPARPWDPGTVGVGAGIEFSAAGVPSAWVTRRDRTLQITQRLTETEWPSFRAFLDYAQMGGSFAWWSSSTDAGSAHTCYLVSPTIDEEVRPARGEFPGDMEITFVIRRTDGAPIDEAYFS